MNQKGFLTSSYHHLLIKSYYFLFFSHLTQIAFSSVDTKFQSCQPQSCGNGPNITFPFYIRDRQPDFCGYPRFDIFCGINNYPILNLSNNHYIIHEIFYNNDSLRVSDPAFSSPNSTYCFPPAQNLNLSGNRFDLAPNQTDFFLLFGCDLKSLPQGLNNYRIGCSKGDTSIETGSVLGFHGNGSDLMDAIGSNKCENEVVKATVEDTKEGALGALRRGFLLKWTATNCSRCEESGGKCGFDWTTYSFRCYCPDGPHSWQCGSETKKTGRTVLKVVTASVVTGVAVLMILAWCLRKRYPMLHLFPFGGRENPTNQLIETFLNEHGHLPTRQYSYSEVKIATNSFTDKLGQGGYGSVYKGKLQDGREVAVKVLSESKGNGEEFINEVASISRTSHVNVVSLLGFCFERSKRALIYEFMPNGSLEKFIYKENVKIADYQLDCEALHKIAIGVARGLEYLHRGCNTRILHMDIKPHNILLDKDFLPKISDFGLAKICQRQHSFLSMSVARGTIGYIAPEVFSRNFGRASHKSDVYSYGMMILEMVGGRKNINIKVECSSEIYFPHWIYRRVELNQEFELLCIKNDMDKERVRKMILVGLWCIQTDPKNRPAMNNVMEMLEGSIESLELPPKPFLTSPSTSPSHHSIQTCTSL